MHAQNGFFSDDNIFSGFVMLELQPITFEWKKFIYDISVANKNILTEPEFECHVTLVGKCHKDDIKSYASKNPFQNILGKKCIIEAEHFMSFFDNETTVAKFAIKDSVSVCTLKSYRNEVFANCRSLETYPNYEPHITIGYFKKGKHPKNPMVWELGQKNQFQITGVMFSYHDANDKMIEIRL